MGTKRLGLEVFFQADEVAVDRVVFGLSQTHRRMPPGDRSSPSSPSGKLWLKIGG